MFKCTGVCSTCGKCKNSAMISGANDRKTKMLMYPDDFVADTQIGYGVAFDIGTTTVVGMLWNLEKGEQIATCAKTNPQNEFGMDVISRINYCGKEGEHFDELRGKILDCFNEIIGELSEKVGIYNNMIRKVILCGNTTMSHIAAGYSPRNLALSPFTLEYTGTLKFTAQEIMLDVAEDGEIIFVPNIAGHVGGDITAGLIAARVLEREGLTLFIDIGTNGEIVLTDGTDSYACSTAAGPAFEGASIKHGMRAAIGAIEKIHIDSDGEVFFKVIGECEPQGICGSGLIDAIAQMIENKIINKTGRMICAEDVDKKNLPEGLKQRLIEVDGSRQFVLVFKENGDDIVITQNDIREVQLAKGAISVGIKLMLDELGKTEGDLDQVIVAGAFGNYIDKKSAMTIGVLPKVSEKKIISAGNTAGVGVSMALASEKEMRCIEEVPEKVQHIELAEKENFQNLYLKLMAFR